MTFVAHVKKGEKGLGEWEGGGGIQRGGQGPGTAAPHSQKGKRPRAKIKRGRYSRKKKKDNRRDEHEKKKRDR